jgi:hypothetical protein
MKGARFMKWPYLPGDLISTPGFLNLWTHWGIVVENTYHEDWRPVTRVFDTTLTRGFSGFTALEAFEGGNGSKLEVRPAPALVRGILERTSRCVGVPYSLLKQTDCESLTRLIFSGEQWSGQVNFWLTLGLASVVVALLNQPEKRRKRRRRTRR